jgi:LmbE family N-acetylglucosaminyl deacetylase/glycosyltransferase involved in cell wall biosynthesis
VTTRVSARSALVIAPHFDDDVLGCGGLIAQLVADGSEVCVLFLSDGSGGEEEISDRVSYAKRRRAEAVHALDILGVTEIDFLDLPDGNLAAHMEEAAAAIRVALVGRRPDLLLTLSPLEVSSDHRAAFAAVHSVLSPLRGGTDLDEVAGNLEILLYEVNHPAYPNLLVDVSNELELVTRAIEAHASQLELHNYLDGALAMRNLRTKSLPTTVKAAEGYRRVPVSEFVTNSPAALVRRLGGVPKLHEIREGPRISVIVRTKDRPALLEEALASIAANTYRRIEVVVVNDGGKPPRIAEDFPLPVVEVNLKENRGRAGAANAGIEAAGGDWIAFLDDDDLAEPEHFATLSGLSEASGVRVVYTDAAVGIYELDPDGGWTECERRLPYSRDFDADLLLFDNYIPFNTLLIERGAFDEAGPFETELPFFEDWDMLIRLSAITSFHHSPQVTAEYRHFRGGGHHIFGERPSERSDFLSRKAEVMGRHSERHTPDALAHVVDLLRAESVESSEKAAARQRELEATRRDFEAARHEFEGVRAELDEHRAAIKEGTDNAQRLYAEIERLNGVIEAMEGTRAWRLHRFAERLRGR